MTRRLRALSAMVAIVAMLFAPLAMALHACDDAMQRALAVEAMAAAMQSGGDAPMDMTLCEHHCAQSKPAFDLAKPAAPAAVAVVPALHVRALEPAALHAPAFDSPFARATGPAPPLIGFTVLRI